MKKLFILGSIFMLSSGIFAQVKTDNNLSSPHGGQIQQADNYFIEMVFSTVDTYVYLYDSNIKPLSNSGITGKLVFEQYDNTTSVVELDPTQENTFVAKTTIPVYLLCRVELDINGKKISTQFGYLDSIANKQK